MSLIFALDFFAPVVSLIGAIVTAIDAVVHNLGWSMIALAALIRVIFWPLNVMQFEASAKMARLTPLLNAVKQKYPNDPQKQQTESMALFKEHGANPLAGCLPLLAQLPVLIGVFHYVTRNPEAFKTATWGWMGTSFATQYPQVFGPNLGSPDTLLLGLYMISMYFSVKLSTPPSTDPQQAMTANIMAVVSPLMIGWFGHQWPSALLLFWLTSNVLQTAQQMFLRMRAAQKAGALAPDGTPVVNVTPRAVSPNRDAAHSSRRPRKGSRGSSR